MSWQLLFVGVAAVVLLLVMSASIAAQDPPQQQVSLTRESVEQLLQVLSPTCRSEMEGALAAQTDISDACKYEIQNALINFGVAAPSSGQGEDQSLPQNQPPRAAQATSSANPVIYIIGFVVLLIAIAVALVVQRSKYLSEKAVFVKPKKLSKKKVGLASYEIIDLCRDSMFVNIVQFSL